MGDEFFENSLMEMIDQKKDQTKAGENTRKIVAADNQKMYDVPQDKTAIFFSEAKVKRFSFSWILILKD